MARHTINNIEYPSVTEILPMPNLMQYGANSAVEYIRGHGLPDCAIRYTEVMGGENCIWSNAKNAHKEISKTARNIGSNVHGGIEIHINNILHNYSDDINLTTLEAENAFKAFLEFEQKYIEKYLYSEQQICEPTLGYAGTLDCVAILKPDMKSYVLDWKTSKAIYPENEMQIAAYAYAWNQTMWDTMMSGIDIIQNMGVVRLDKETAQYQFKDCTEKYDRRLAAFKCLVQYYYLAKKRRLKNNPLAV